MIREMLAQSALLGIGGGTLGVLLAPVVARGLISYLPENIDLSGAIEPRVMLFTLAIAVGTALLGMMLFGEPRDLARILCILLIIGGIVGLKFTTAT